MKNMFKFCVLALSVVVMLACAGCAARTAITSDDFQKQAKSSGFTVTAETSPSTYVTKDFLAAKNDSDIQITFLSFDTAEHAQSWFSTQKGSQTGSEKTIVDTETYNKCTVTNGEIYSLLIRMDNTFVSCKTTLAKKSEVDNFISTIKY